MKKTLVILACIGAFSFANAEESKSEDHSAHHPNGAPAEGNKMKKMKKMEHMHSMMENCSKDMPKHECMKMMKEHKKDKK